MLYHLSAYILILLSYLYFQAQHSDGIADDHPNDSFFSPTYHHHNEGGLNNLTKGIKIIKLSDLLPCILFWYMKESLILLVRLNIF
jgi:hypothetical protein